MVFIQFKKSEKNNFTIQCPSTTLVQDVISKLIQINNLRIYLDRLTWSLQQMSTKGVLRPHQLQGISYEQYQKNKKQFSDLPQQKLQFATKPIIQFPAKFVVDKHFQRHGVILPQQQNKILVNAIKKVNRRYNIKNKLFKFNKYLIQLKQYEMLLWRYFLHILEFHNGSLYYLFYNRNCNFKYYKAKTFNYMTTSQVYGGQVNNLIKKHIGQYSGKNQKTKIIVKLQKFGGQQPAREPPIDAETYNKMVKFYYKKVQQNKQFEQKSVEHHYEKIQTQNMKEKLYIHDTLKYKPF